MTIAFILMTLACFGAIGVATYALAALRNTQIEATATRRVLDLLAVEVDRMAPGLIALALDRLDLRGDDE